MFLDKCYEQYNCSALKTKFPWRTVLSRLSRLSRNGFLQWCPPWISFYYSRNSKKNILKIRKKGPFKHIVFIFCYTTLPLSNNYKHSWFRTTFTTKNLNISCLFLYTVFLGAFLENHIIRKNVSRNVIPASSPSVTVSFFHAQDYNFDNLSKYSNNILLSRIAADAWRPIWSYFGVTFHSLA